MPDIVHSSLGARPINVAVVSAAPYVEPDGLWLHYDASELTGYNEGEEVTVLPNLSTVGASFNAVKVHCYTAPLYKTGTLNGLPTLLFSDQETGRGLNIPNAVATAMSGFTGITLFAVIKVMATSVQRILSVRLDGNWLKFGLQADSGSSNSITFYARPNVGMRNYIAVSSGEIGSDFALVAYDVVVATGVARAWLNDGPAWTDFNYPNGTTFDNNGYPDYNFLSRADWTPFYGYLAELKVYNNPLSDIDREKVRDYMIYKWGL